MARGPGIFNFIAVLVVLVIAIYFISPFFQKTNFTITGHTVCIGSVETKKSAGDEKSLVTIPFTTEELEYLKYGSPDNTTTLIHPRDERYLQLIRSQIARPTPGKKRQLAAGAPGQHEKVVEEKLNKRKNGFFIECGANDGEFQSNTAYFETNYGWNGLLVEANPALVQKLLARNRQFCGYDSFGLDGRADGALANSAGRLCNAPWAYVYGGCLSPTKQPATLKFKSAGCCGGLVDQLTSSQEYLISLYSANSQQIDLVQCYPLGDLLAALDVKHVDYLSLDVHGAELSILKTIDFSEIRIDIMTVECYDKNSTQRAKMANDIVELFAKTGLYKPVEIVPGDLVIERINLNLP